MIDSKAKLREYIERDALANGRSTLKASFFGDEIWKFQLCMRKLEYHTNKKGSAKKISLFSRLYYKHKFHKYSLKLSFSIPVNVIGKGFSIAHYGTIVVSRYAKIGDNFRIHEGVTIGATNGTRDAAVIGNNVYIASGAKIIGGVTIADDVAIGANAVVTRSIEEPATTWGGIPAKKISDKDSHANLSKSLFE